MGKFPEATMPFLLEIIIPHGGMRRSGKDG
jgi:hypothetical protein